MSHWEKTNGNEMGFVGDDDQFDSTDESFVGDRVTVRIDHSTGVCVGLLLVVGSNDIVGLKVEGVSDGTLLVF
eukprot:CAMPEP_0195514116 /NCGR_PEP_ID=MMETSP0794_2-20130614/5600_1 /TAXON_ID=515487 /ORGANISM="Stephanopyxis turris, Strain CCMP 815" /LENGTH=72 /DNA_ID=CAMNT_0040642285 /DNA_START=501 /DNA_END=719 /DNA_ORIENTATION=+